MQTSLDLEDIVIKPTWKELLLELITTNGFDPWNVDIIEIANSFLKKVREMEKLDLAIPANIILAAAILLRYKSEVLRFEGETTVEQQLSEPPVEMPQFEELPVLTLTDRIPPKRQFTITELMDEIERVIRYDSTERIKKRQAQIEVVQLALNGIDMEKKMEEVLEQIKKNTDVEGWALFSSLLKGKEKKEVVYMLLSVLHLTQKKLIGIRQDELWGEIFIKLRERKN